MKNIFSNPRVIASVIITITILGIVCLGLYVWADPQFNAIATATRVILTQNSGIATKSAADTQTALPLTSGALTREASLTLTAVPTITPTFTLTPTLTFTPSLTPPLTLTNTPEITGCLVDVSSRLVIYRLPSVAVSELTTTDSGDKILVLADAKGIDWYLVETSQGQRGWIIKSELKSVDCVLASPTLAYLAGWDHNRNYVYNDNFAGPNTWKDQDGQPITPIPYENSYLLHLVRDINQASPFNVEPPLSNFSEFSVYTSFLFVSNPDYVGVRFWDNGADFYELRIYNDCQIALFDSATIDSPDKRITIGGQSYCHGGQSGYLEFHVIGSRLNVTLNDGQVVPFVLDNIYDGNKFSIMNSLADVKFEYLVITSP